MRSDRLRVLVAFLVAACHSSDPAQHAAPDAETLVRYDGTVTVTPDGAMQSQTHAGSVSIGATTMNADGCAFHLSSDDNGTLSYAGNGIGNCTGMLTETSSSASATLTGTMLTVHWSELGTDDAKAVYDFAGARAN
jgi:hypothetical protein